MQLETSAIWAWLAGYWPAATSLLRTITWALVLSAMAGIGEVMFSTGHHAGLGGRLRNFGIGLIFFLVCLAAEPPLGRITLLVVGADGDGLLWPLLPATLRQGLPGAVIGTVLYAVVWDVFQYFMHRLEHALPLLWALHRLHHSDRAVNATTAFRQHPATLLVSFPLAGLPTAALCGLHAVPALGATVLFAAWGCLNHADIRLPLGRWGMLLSGPQWHRLHHGVERQYYDCNFAAFFPWIDRLFGTYRHPQQDEYPATGAELDVLTNRLERALR